MKRILLVTLLFLPVPAWADATFLADFGVFIAHTCDDDGSCQHPNMQAGLFLSGPDFSLGAPMSLGLSANSLIQHSLDEGASSAIIGQTQYIVKSAQWTFAGGTFGLGPNGFPANIITNTITVITNGTWSGTESLTPVFYPPEVCPNFPCVKYHLVDVDYHLTPFQAPEPSTWVLLGSGLLGLVLWRRRHIVNVK